MSGAGDRPLCSRARVFVSKVVRQGAALDTLSFPNPSRSYDEQRCGVRFWGYDRTMEVEFLVEDGVLLELTSGTTRDEPALLSAFDVNRGRICAVAESVYSRRRRSAHIFSYTLTNADFLKVAGGGHQGAAARPPRPRRGPG